MVLQMHVTMMMDKSTPQPSWVNNGCSRAYLLSFLLVTSMGKQSLQYVKDLEF